MMVMQHFVLWRFGLAPAETQTTEAEPACLAHYAKGRARLAEIGVWHGVTTRRLRQAMSADGWLYAVDPYPRGRLGFSTQLIIGHREAGKVRNGSVVWVRMTGADAARELLPHAPFDFVFIDGDHTYQGLQADWAGWSPLMAEGGYVALHDSRSTPQRRIDDAGSVRFTRDVIKKDARFEVVDAVDSLTILRRVGLTASLPSAA